MKRFEKTCIAGIALFTAVFLLLAGCASGRDVTDGKAEAEIQTVAAPAESSTAPVENGSALFETLFVPAAEGSAWLRMEKFKADAEQCGFRCFEEAGVVMVLSSENAGEYIRGEITYENGSAEITALVYGITKDEESRVVQVKLGGDIPEYYTGVTLYREGIRVNTIEDVRAYLTAEELPGDDAKELKENAGTHLSLFEEIFLPAADGSQGNDWEKMKSVLTAHGYYYFESEGQFSVEDQENPGSYIYGMLTTENNYWEFAELGYRLVLPEEERNVKVVYYTNNRWDPQYYVAVSLLENGTPVESVEEMREYIQTGKIN